jgi:signal transduction protein with GAF and PtsI domain
MEDDSTLTRHQLLACLELGKALAAELDATRLLDTILHKVSALLPAEHWSLLLLDEATGELRFELSVDLEPSVIRGLRLRPGEGIAGQVALRQQPMLVTDVSTSPFFSRMAN